MRFEKKRFRPLLTLILCTVLAVSVPLSVTVAAAEVENFSNFTYASYFTAEWTQTNTSGSSNVSVSGSTISFSATGSGSGCDAASNETKVTLTALKDVSITCTLGGSAILSPPGEVTNNSDESKTFIVGAGSSVSFSVSGGNESTTGNGSVTFTKVEETKSLVPTDCASFSFNNKFYSYLDKALEDVGSGGGTITVVKGGTLYHSSVETDPDYANKTFTFVIPDKVTLLVPFNSANTLVGSDPSDNLLDAYADVSSPRSEYCKLIMPSKTNITVSSGGAICISSRIANQFIGQLGAYGAIYMNANSNITVQSGGNLYAWGYIFYGDSTGGSVSIENGGTVYEPISIMDYPGSSSLTNTLKNNGVFPMRAYTVRNVEVPMTLYGGAKEYVYYSLFGSRIGTYPGKVLMFANGVIDGNTPVFQMGSDTTVTKSFIGKTQYITINGNIALNPLKVIIDASFLGGSVEFSSSETPGFILPSGFDVTLASGTMTLNDNVVMVEGTKLTIAQDAVANTNGKNLYLTGNTDDVGAVEKVNGCSIYVQNVHGDYYTRVAKDAVLDVNGTLKAGSTFYTSSNKAEVTSSEGTGVIEIAGAPAAASIRVKDASNSYQTINYTNAQLKNADGTYVDTSANNYTYDLSAGAWRCETHTGVEKDHDCDVCGARTECTDTDDHNCDVCGKEGISECKDEDGNAVCDICQKVLCEHETVTPTEAVAATCETDGTKAYWTCSDCNSSYADESCTALISDLDAWKADTTENGGCIPAIGHAYAVVENGYTWAEDYTKVTASGVCANDETHTVTVDSEKVDTATTAATCIAKGETIYTATFAEDSELTNLETQTATVELEIDENAHADADTNHVCDNGCGKSDIGAHADSATDGDHICDYGCKVVLSICGDEGKDHSCDTDSACAVYSTGNNAHVDANKDHNCDYGCSEKIGTCADGDDFDHNCDYCGAANISEHSFTVQNIDEAYLASAADCTNPAKYYLSCTCGVKGTETFNSGEALGHDWADATCTEAKTCKTCGETEGDAQGHDWSDATCTEAKTCKICGETEGNALGHDWSDATCTEAKTCKICGETEGNALGHTYGEPVWSWTGNDTDGYTAASAAFTCTVCEEDTQMIPDNVIDVATTEPTTEAEGSTIYTATVTFNGQTYSDTKTVVIPKVEIELNPIVDKTGTTTPANITAPEGGWQLGENKFTVSCAKACVVAYTTIGEDGETVYNRLTATAAKDADGNAIIDEDGNPLYYTFTIDELQADTQIVVAIKGDVNSDGKVNASDTNKINKYIITNSLHEDLSDFEYLMADLTGDNRVNASDANIINKFIITNSLHEDIVW